MVCLFMLHNSRTILIFQFPSFFLFLKVARLQMSVLRALQQETVGGADVQEALSRLESDLLDITMVTQLYCSLCV